VSDGRRLRIAEDREGTRWLRTIAEQARQYLESWATRLSDQGVTTATRVVPGETKPDCPFPSQVELVPQVEQGRVNIGMPIDIPFPEVSRLLETRLKGKTFSVGIHRLPEALSIHQCIAKIDPCMRVLRRGLCRLL
jgi:hypothetical protein